MTTYRRGLPQVGGADDSSEDLGVSRLGQVADEEEGFGGEGLAHVLHDAIDQLALDFIADGVVAGFEDDEADQGLAFEIVRDADGGGFLDGGVGGEDGFDLGRAEALASIRAVCQPCRTRCSFAYKLGDA